MAADTKGDDEGVEKLAVSSDFGDDSGGVFFSVGGEVYSSSDVIISDVLSQEMLVILLL